MLASWFRILSLGVLGLAASAAFSAELYSEHQYLTRERLFASQTQVRTALTPGTVFPFLQVGNDWLSRGEDPFRPAAGSYAHVAPGVGTNVGPVVLRAETRFRAFYQPSPNQSLVDFRMLAAWGAFTERPVAPRTSLFAEPYTEAVFTSADRRNMLVTAFTRAGGRYRLGTGITFDLYVEPRLQWDRLRRVENNRLEGRLGARLTAVVSGVTVSGFAAALWTKTTVSSDAPKPGASFLLVVGGPL